MTTKKILSIFFLLLFSANQVSAAKYYFQSSNLNHEIFLGDLDFSYSFIKTENNSSETFERNLTRVTVERTSTESTLWIEQKTRIGLLYLRYKNIGTSWENTNVSFRRYSSFFKDDGDDDCSTPAAIKNQIDIGNLAKSTEKKNFSELFFEKNCSQKLSEVEFNNLTDAIYSVLGADNNTLASIKKPAVLLCVKAQGQQSTLYAPFSTLRKQVSLHVQNTDNINSIKSNSNLPMPISCDFDGQKNALCGKTTEGIKSKISIDVSCLKKDPTNFKEKAIELFMHEFAHTIRDPKIISEKQIREHEKGNCGFKDYVFPGKNESDISKNEIIKKINTEQSGSKTIAGDVINPYNSFAERVAPSTSGQATSIAGNESSAAEVSSATSGGTAQQRSIASTNSFNSVSSLASKSATPTMQQQAQYQNVKTYVDASVNTVAKKIAPIVSYVESPAFAKTLPPTSFENSNSGDSIDTSVSVPTATSTGAVAKAATTNRTQEGAKASSGSSSSSGSNEVASGGGSAPANLGSSTSATGSTSRKPAAVNKNANRLSNNDSGLDNAYALKVRKKLLSDSNYRSELRSKGVQIEFADGYKFETPGHQVLYTEKNGVLVGDK